MRIVKRVGGWLYDRSRISPIVQALLSHKIPPEVGRSRKGWFYVFGQALVFLFLFQVVTGTGLAMAYVPAPAFAWDSLRYLNEEVFWGAFLRALHFFGASAMILLTFVHLSRVFLTGSYKFPREPNWMSGVILLFLVLAMAFTGQLLRWDQDGVWTVMVAAQFAGRTPLVGEYLMQLILAGETLGGGTLTRFFALHVVILPLLILVVMGFHIYLVFQNGISEPPRAGRPVDKESYRAWYTKLVREGGSTHWPDAAGRELVFVAFVLLAVFAFALTLGPQGPGPAPDPTALEADPRPDWYFRWYYALIWLKPRVLDEVVLVWFPIFLGLSLLALPILFPDGERAPSRRPWAVFAVGMALLCWGTLTAFGLRPHWVPNFETEPLPAEQLEGASAGAREGAQVFFDRGCQFCHQVHGHGGIYGPDLTAATRRMPPEEITIRTMIGVRDMPAYYEVLTSEEMDRIVAYLRWAAGGDE